MSHWWVRCPEDCRPSACLILVSTCVGQTGTTEIVSGERPNLVPLLHAFARDFLEVDYMFWVDQEPYFTDDLLGCLETVKDGYDERAQVQ